jgi:hypothetical protein
MHGRRHRVDAGRGPGRAGHAAPLYVDSWEAFAAMPRAVSVGQPRPVIGATYALAPVGDAYRWASGGQVIGQVVITA